MFKKWIAQKPRLDPGNYGFDGNGVAAFHAEAAAIREQRARARLALKAAEALPYSPEALERACVRAFSGRLEIRTDEEGTRLEYCVGQYWPTEYRLAAAVVLEEYHRQVLAFVKPPASKVKQTAEELNFSLVQEALEARWRQAYEARGHEGCSHCGRYDEGHPESIVGDCGIPDAPFYVLSNDPFFSGEQPNGDDLINTCVVPVASAREAKAVVAYVESRKDQNRIRVVDKKPRSRSGVRLSLVWSWRQHGIERAQALQYIGQGGEVGKGWE